MRDLALHYGMRALSTDACSALGAWLGGHLGRRGHPAADARAKALLMRLRPDWAEEPEVLEANLQQLWSNVGRTYAEFAAIRKIVGGYRNVMCGEPQLEEVYASDRPLILCFVHLGNWEVLGHCITSHPMLGPMRPFIGLAMPPANRAHALIAVRQRASLPIDLLPMGRHVWHRVIETLRQPGGIVWMAADEAAGGRVHAPLFGRRPRIDSNLGKIVRLAAATGARVLPMYNERLGLARFRSHILPVMEMPSGRLTEEAAQQQIYRINEVFEPIVRRLLTQWYMAIEFDAEAGDNAVG